jgi:hypothetical protein
MKMCINCLYFSGLAGNGELFFKAIFSALRAEIFKVPKSSTR